MRFAEIAREAGIAHFVYVSVAQPAPVMRDYVAARAAGVSTLAAALTRENHRALLAPELHPGDLLVNLSVGVSSTSVPSAARSGSRP